jgi:hypothetical protein
MRTFTSVGISAAGFAVGLALIVMPTAAANIKASTTPPTGSVVASVPFSSSGGSASVVKGIGVSLCIEPRPFYFICVPGFGPISTASVGTTIWTDTSTPGTPDGPLPPFGRGGSSFQNFVAKITNGTSDLVMQGTRVGSGGWVNFNAEPIFFGSQVGAGGVDLSGYVIQRIGLRVDALTIDTPGTDPNDDGIWTDVSLRGAFLFEAALPVSKAQCKEGGWQNFGLFKNQGDCVSYVATGGTNPPANG